MKKKKISLAIKILIGMVLGLICGFIFKGQHEYWTYVTDTVGTIFIRLLKMTILPLILCSIIGGIASIANLKRLKKIGIRFIIYWILASFLAAVCGLVWSYIIQPGVGVNLAESAESYSTEGVNLLQTVINYIPDNVFASMANFSIIQVIVFAIFAGIGISTLPAGKAKDFLTGLFESGNDLMIRIVEMVMKLAPIGVFCLMAEVSGTLGAEVLGALGKMLVTQYVAYATLIVIVFPLILIFIAKVNPIKHYKNVFPAMILAFSSCSSSATLPLTMKCAKERCGVPEETVGLIAPPAATINMQACCAEMAIYAVFAAQLFGRSYGIGELAMIIFLGVIMAAGVAGVPGGGIMMSAIMMETMGLPLTIVPWVAGIYRLIDMPNTMLNVTGDTVGMVTVSAMMGDLDREVFNTNHKPVDQ
ncbi:dicarboxylate/amino acid:cation symporter [Fusibacillus kribbianus]|uniref:Dicarboxylate/amino acid:cation symporter n=1 Tax=Fusibacillus kribbianus TaxID=3044208 RepID=A0AAP4BAJ9_9FIRM|nr:dicarboxylate/amino acid:cation symporter [Ruminococcus sp. YH-rum2234]MDI9242714.1 dicarboxylate/amino acid:cation symporter [Ruminococcus sp. YH-rum2234]